MVEKRTVSTFNAINLFKKLKTALESLGFKKILMSNVDQNEKLHIWFVAPDIKTLNNFLWAGCHRYYNLHERQLFSVHIDHGDPDKTSSELKLVMSTNEVFTEDKLVDFEDFVTGVNDFSKYLDSLDTGKETPVDFLEGESVKCHS